MIGQNAVSHPTLDQVIGHIGMGSVYKTAHNGVAAIQLGNGLESVLIQKTLCCHAIDPLADAAVPAVNYVLDTCAVWQINAYKVPHRVILVRCGLSSRCLAQQFAIGGVGVSCPAVLEQAVLIIITTVDRNTS
ncbi:MAG: hypothetical protein NG747_02075 [Candidatus Brocadia sp.]|nr:hypothetical protein [Candidatus Brocadia sp.]